MPPQPEPCQDAVLGLTMIHSMNIDSSRVHSTYNSFLHCYNQETLVYLSQVQTLASLMQKWVWFLQNMGVVQKFSHALCARLISCAPTMPRSNIFLRLCYCIPYTKGTHLLCCALLESQFLRLAVAVKTKILMIAYKHAAIMTVNGSPMTPTISANPMDNFIKHRVSPYRY